MKNQSVIAFILFQLFFMLGCNATFGQRDTTFTFSNEFNTQTIPISEYHKYFLMGYAFSVYKSQGDC